MPVHRGIDEKGHYQQWGNHGAKYYFTPGNKQSEDHAIAKAHAQARAAYAHGYRE